MDNLEMELKIWCPDLGALERLLKKSGANQGEIHLETDVYYNHPARDFKQTDEALRLRRVKNETVLTYKGPKLSPVVKTRIEQEVGIESFEQMEKVLLSLGFKKVGLVQKKRSAYHLKGIDIFLDVVDGVGDFVELEKLGTNKQKIEAELLDMAEELNLRYIEDRSYLELVLDKAKPPF